MAADQQNRATGVEARQCTIMDQDWCQLAWTPWLPLDRDDIRRGAPALPGVYRIRSEDRSSNRLIYIGQTGRTLRERLLALASGVNAEECPFNDPHTAAPHLWLLQRLDGARLECSCAPVTGDVQILRGTEDMLLWRHRVETGLPVQANYGRFYPGYARPTNRWIVSGGRSSTRIPGRAAALLRDGSTATDFSISHPALQGDTGLLQAPWWQQAPLTQVRSLPAGPAVYCIYGHGSDEPVYVGETFGLRARAAKHAAAQWPVRKPWLAYLPLPIRTPRFVLRELESDLLGWHFSQTGRAPAAQYTVSSGTADLAEG
jgi:hypothetical protein